jgi:ABC-type transporter Mla maintaining outer membrane lipid asymmetry ATPase subunit MlaF
MLELRGLTRRYGDLVALDDLSFTVRGGQMFGFVGPNGAGKTTAMRIILGVLEADAGQVLWRGQPMKDDMRKRVGFLPEDHGQTFLRRFAADRSSWPIADDTRTSSRPARRAAALVVDDGRTGRWLTELGFAGQAAAFTCDL